MADENKDLRYSFTGDDSSFQAAAKRVLASFNSLITKAKAYSSAANSTSTATAKAAKAQTDAARSMSKYQKAGASVTSMLTSLNRAFKTLTGLSIARLFSDAVTNSIEYVESLNLFNVALGDSTKQATKFINTMSEKLGLDPAEIMKQVGTFQNLAESLGMSSDAAYILSTNFAKLANDLASLWNTSTIQAASALQSAIVGQTRSIRQYGIDTTIAALSQTALSLGITQSVASMSRANKTALLYITVMRQASSSMGDFARTIESPANQLRILQAQFKNLSRAIGDFFLGTIGGILPYLNGIVMALTAVLRTFASLLGIKIGDFSSAIGGSSGSIESGLEGVGDAADTAAKKMKNLVAPFDELNIISQDTASSAGDIGFGGGGIDSSLLDAMKEYDNLMDQVQMKATRIRDRIMEILGFTKQVNEETGEITWTWNWEDMKKGLKKGWEGLMKWWDSLDPGGKLAAILVGGFIGGLAFKGLAGIGKILLKPLVSVFSGAFKIIGTFIKFLKGIDWTSIFGGLTKVAESISKSFGGVSGSLGLVIGVIVAIITSIAAFWDYWNSNAEYRQRVTDEWQDICDKFLELWNVLKNNVIVPIGTTVKALVDQIIALIKLVGSIVEPIWNSLWNNLGKTVGDVVLSLMGVLEGLIEFLTGIFSLDLGTALKGLLRIFLNIGRGIFSIFAGIVNFVIDGVNWVVDQLNKIQVTIPNWGIFGSLAGKTFGVNIGHIAYMEVPSLDTLFGGYANGGFLESGQLFRAGEGNRYEMIGDFNGKQTVMPLENTGFTSAMGDAVRRGVIDALQLTGMGSGQAVDVHVYIGGKNFDKVVYDSYNKESRARGASILGGALYANT